MTKFALAGVALWTCSGTELSFSANPVRKVVTMLQMMQKKIETEGEKEKELFDKFMCYCNNGKSDLEASVAVAEEKSGSLPAAVEQAQADVKQLKVDLKTAQTDRAAAETAMAEATAIREKEASAFAKESGDLNTNVAAMNKAIAALEKGQAGSFLQSGSADVLRNLAQTEEKMADVDRDDLTAFLSGSDSHGTSPGTDSIIGILKQMQHTAAATLKEVTETEQHAISDYDALMKAKKKEVVVLTARVEDHLKRIGDTGVEIVMMEQSLTDSEESLLEDRKLLKELETNCATRADEWKVACKTRSEELLALADTIKILNDDDALELFKKTLPGASSFLQIQVTDTSMRELAASGLTELRTSRKSHRQRINFVLMALQGKKVATDKIIKMIDNMVDLLKKEQIDDDNKKEYCTAQFDFTDDRKKETERTLGKLSTDISHAVEEVATLAEDMEALGKGVAELDKMVAEATANRKEENSDYTTLMASDTAARELLGFAKNRLNKFYNPKLYKAPPKVDGSTMLVQIHAHGTSAYSKKGEESAGVISMIDTLIADLAKEMTEAEVTEKQSQEEYDELMTDSAQKRMTDSASLSDKGAAKGDLETKLAEFKDEKKSTTKELMALEEYLSQLHSECDWLIKYFDVRKEARSGDRCVGQGQGGAERC